MLKNYLIIAIRNLMRHKLYSAINIAGLALGMACCILILLFVQYERSYDRFHEHADRIYRVGFESRVGDQTIIWPRAPIALAEELRGKFSEVVHVAKIYRQWQTHIQYGEKKFYEQHGLCADASFFDVFSFKLIQGNPKTALSDLHSIVITQQFAKKYFDDEDPMGKTIRFSDRDMVVTGIVEDVPPQSHFKFDFLISIENFSMIGENAHLWTSVYVYVLLTSADAAAGLEARLFQSDTVAWHRERRDVYNPFLQALTDIHLFSHLDQELAPNRDVRDLYLFSGIALLILTIACVNYMNLSTARSVRRAREVGVRKVVGAHRGQLVYQLLSESVLTTALAFVMALALAELMLPVFNAHAQAHLQMFYGDGSFWLGITALGVGIGVLSGSYPAFVLSAFQPVEVLKGAAKAHPAGAWLRKGLVVFQFAASIALIVVTSIVFNQLAFVKNKALGFDKEQVVVINAGGIREVYTAFASGRFGRYDAFQNELLRNPNVLSIGASMSVIGDASFRPQFEFTTEDKPDQIFRGETLFVDYGFFKTMGIQFREGRDFSREFATDLRDAVILNETAVRELGWENPIGKRMTRKGMVARHSEVIGVVKDFHTQSLHHPIDPLIIGLFPPEAGFVKFFAIKIRTDQVSETLGFLAKTWEKWAAPGHPFEYSFLDENYDALYRAEMQMLQTFGIFSTLAILIACLGLFGLAAFTAQQRTKEIGIRKVLGASVSGIVLMLSKDFVKLVLIANLIAWPVAYYAMNRWLENFAYRMNLSWEVFVLSGGLALSIALVTVSGQAWQAARANPVDALRNE